MLIALWLPLFGFGQENISKDLRAKIKAIQETPKFSLKDTSYINLLNDLAKEFRYYNPDSAFTISKNALKLSERANYKSGEILSLIEIGMHYSDNGNSKKAIENYRKALKIAKSIHNHKLIIRVQNGLAGEYAYMGDYAEALNIYLLALEKAHTVNDKLMLSILSENIAGLYLSQKDFESALEWYQKIITINEEIGDPIVMAETKSNLASLYKDMQNYDLAMFNINKSIRIFEKHDKLDWLAYSYQVKGDVYLKQSKYTWAVYWYEQCKLLHKKIDDDRAMIDLLNGMSKAQLGKQNDSLSKIYALEGYAISKKIKALEGQKECSKTLYEIEKRSGNYDEALTFHEIYQDLSEILSKGEAQKSLSMLKTKMDYEKQKEDLIASNKQELAKQQGYINAALLILAVFMITTFLVYRSTKIQKKLNKELKSKRDTLKKRETELRDMNETKDKLFSIIGHDLRGPVGALQGLLKLFKNGEIEETEFMKFMPKLSDDIDHISFTLNNLLSWGQSQMNGTVTRPALVALENLVSENINLLNEIAENKSIKLISKVQENTLAWSDSNQIDIVIRNLISNALKFTPKNGMVTIEAQEQNDCWIVSIRDTGVGMQKEIQEKIFSSNSNITTYGTNNEKGTGLGLSLCKEMVENNGGKIWLDSIPRKGSTFYFSVPKSTKKYNKAG
ncbi:tetratricopeptide repeat-containing sensor histidine kinase [Costertonia aggregata]|uniref:tetratricopeptide repeat-containing sensor histidine kinase n=1 Tax=Costertonia aggregata TaxID=343403 RepID=UPI001D1485D2|nr:tetratricopeptide repeat-containing sensor histidine kinase [Costertonia aggregata]